MVYSSLNSQINYPAPDYARAQSLISMGSGQFFDYTNSFVQSLGTAGQIPYTLTDAENEPLIKQAIRYITNSIIGLPWVVYHEDGGVEHIEQIKKITKALKKPNGGEIDTYSKMISAIVTDVIRWNVSVIGRKPQAFEDGQVFYLFVNDPKKFQKNPKWNPEISGVEPRYFMMTGRNQFYELYDKDVFLIQPEVNSDGTIPQAPLQVAFETIKAWKNLYKFQIEMAASATRDTMIVLEDANATELDAYRSYWETQVEGRGKRAIVGGMVKTVPISQRNDEFALALAEYLIGIIGITFGFSPRDMGMKEPDNKSTAEIASSSTFIKAVKPLAELIIDTFSSNVVDYYYPGFGLKLYVTEPRSQSEEAATTMLLYDKGQGIISRDEARAIIGEKAEGLAPVATADPDTPHQLIDENKQNTGSPEMPATTE